LKGGDKIVNKHHSLPIKFEKIEGISNVVDDRFIPVKIYIAHTGENRNRSIFTKEVLEGMIPSLANIPILGYIAVNEDEEQDFQGHEERLVVEDGEFKIKYVGHAYGLIPVDNDAHFEFRYGEDGVEREYLVANGLLWRKFKEVEEIFDRDGGFKSQSMELQPSSVKGHLNDEGLFVFEQAKFEGACILGEGVTPAMISSTIEKFSVADKIQNELGEMLTEFNAHFSTLKEKGDDIVKEESQVLENENTEFETQAEETTTVVEKTPVVEGEGKTVDEFTTEENPVTNEDFVAEERVEEKFTVKFELSHDDIRTGLYNALYEHEFFKDLYVYIAKVFDSYAIIEVEDYSSDKYEERFFKINYVKHENAVSLGEFEELFPMFLTQSEKEIIDAQRNNFTALEEEVKELREYKAKVELSEKEKQLSQYSSVLSKEEYDSIKENLDKFSMQEIEKEIGFILLKKNHFSAKSEEEGTQSRVGVVNTNVANPYGSASIYFTKN
jgi:hypothetical protein